MPPRYATVQQVADSLGTDLTGLQSIEAERLLLAAEAWIDAYTDRTWGIATPLTELQTVIGQGVYLRQRPVTSVDTVAVRSAYVGASWDTLPVSSYELLDPEQGLVLLPWAYAGWLARVTYLPVVTVPPEVSLAATTLVSSWLKAGEIAGSGRSGPIVSRRLGDVEVRYATPAGGAAAAASAAAPPLVLSLLAPYRQVVCV